MARGTDGPTPYNRDEFPPASRREPIGPRRDAACFVPDTT